MAQRPAKKAMRLVSDFGTTRATWHTDPAVDDVAQAGNEYLAHLVVLHLRGRGLRPKDLAAACGGAVSAWRNKMNGTRAIDMADIVAIAMALDPGVLDALPSGPQGASDLLPEVYRGLLSDQGGDGRLPTFRPQHPSWQALAAGIEAWWKAEAQAGRGWALTEDVLRFQLLQALEDHGMPSRSSSPTGVPEPSGFASIVWVAREMRVRVAHLGTGASASDVTGALTVTGRLLWGTESATPAAGATLVVLAASRNATSNIADALRLGERPVGAFSIGEAERLGVSEPASRPDINLTWSRYEPQSPLIWLLLKS